MTPQNDWTVRDRLFICVEQDTQLATLLKGFSRYEEAAKYYAQVAAQLTKIHEITVNNKKDTTT